MLARRCALQQCGTFEESMKYAICSRDADARATAPRFSSSRVNRKCVLHTGGASVTPPPASVRQVPCAEGH